MGRPDKIHFTCPQCGTAVRAPLELGGKRAKCKKCNTKVLVPFPTVDPTAAPLPLEESVPEPLELDDHEPGSKRLVTVECPNCSSKMQVERSDIGRKIDCPRCDQRVRVPEPERAQRQPKDRQSRRRTRWPWYVGGAVVAVFVGFGLLVGSRYVYEQYFEDPVPEKVIGTWENVKDSGHLVQFSRNGTFQITIDGKVQTGTYRLREDQPGNKVYFMDAIRLYFVYFSRGKMILVPYRDERGSGVTVYNQESPGAMKFKRIEN